MERLQKTLDVENTYFELLYLQASNVCLRRELVKRDERCFAEMKKKKENSI